MSSDRRGEITRVWVVCCARCGREASYSAIYTSPHNGRTSYAPQSAAIRAFHGAAWSKTLRDGWICWNCAPHARVAPKPEATA